jgi:hypothetical protein
MTRIVRENVACRLCGTETNLRVLYSSNTFGGLPDLDGRPPEMLRSTMWLWVQRCPACGLCATNLAKEIGEVMPVIPLAEFGADAPGPATPGPPDERRKLLWSAVRDAGYRAQLSNWRFPSLANSFLCQSMVEEADREYGRAACAVLHAAWVCDDQPLCHEQASACRRRAIALMREATRRGQEIKSEVWTERVLLTDCLRRCGDLPAAAEECARELTLQPDERLRSLLEYEAVLIQRQDSQGRSLSDAIRWAPAAWNVSGLPSRTDTAIGGVALAIMIWIIFSVILFAVGRILIWVFGIIVAISLVTLFYLRLYRYFDRRR